MINVNGILKTNADSRRFANLFQFMHKKLIPVYAQGLILKHPMFYVQVLRWRATPSRHRCTLFYVVAGDGDNVTVGTVVSVTVGTIVSVTVGTVVSGGITGVTVGIILGDAFGPTFVQPQRSIAITEIVIIAIISIFFKSIRLLCVYFLQMRGKL
jgi:hypothetical protein